jgi:hypothetical protein
MEATTSCCFPTVLNVSIFARFFLFEQILDSQKKDKPGASVDDDEEGASGDFDDVDLELDDTGVELGPTTRRRGHNKTPDPMDV